MQRSQFSNGALIAIDHMVFLFTEASEGYCKIKEVAICRSDSEIMILPELSQRECLATLSGDSLQLFTQFGYSTVMLYSEEIPFSKIRLSDIKL